MLAFFSVDSCACAYVCAAGEKTCLTNKRGFLRTAIDTKLVEKQRGHDPFTILTEQCQLIVIHAFNIIVLFIPRCIDVRFCSKGVYVSSERNKGYSLNCAGKSSLLSFLVSTR